MRQLIRFLWVLLQVLGTDTVLVVPGHTLFDPTPVPLFIGSGHNEKLDLHLLELADAKDEILRRDFVSIRLADLCDTEWEFPVCRIENVLEIDENALRRFRPEISDILFVFDRANGCLEHEIERPGLGEIVKADLGAFLTWVDLIGAKAFFAFAAVDERIRESRFMAGVTQDKLVHEDSRVKTFDIVALVDGGTPPNTLDVIFQLDAHRAVVPRSLQAAVEFASLKKETTPLAQRHDLVHRCTGHRPNIAWRITVFRRSVMSGLIFLA